MKYLCKYVSLSFCLNKRDTSYSVGIENIRTVIHFSRNIVEHPFIDKISTNRRYLYILTSLQNNFHPKKNVIAIPVCENINRYLALVKT